jgi:hypothetical protein
MNTVGIEVISYSSASSVTSSTSIFTNFTSGCSSESSSITGHKTLQGQHHVAKKSAIIIQFVSFMITSNSSFELIICTIFIRINIIKSLLFNK